MNRTRFYSLKWFMWITLILFPPIGIALLWIFHKELTRKFKVITTILFIVWFGLILLIGSQPNENNTQDVISSNATHAVESIKPQVIQTPTTTPTLSPTNTPILASTDSPKPTLPPTEEPAKKEATLGESNCVDKAESYLDLGGFSKESLSKQLKYEGFSAKEISYAIKNCDADWNEQALEKAKSYLNMGGSSNKGLHKQLEYEGFTAKQITYAIKNADADWNEQAAIKAKSYLDMSSFSKSGLHEQLAYEGFKKSEINYALDKVGY